MRLRWKGLKKNDDLFLASSFSASQHLSVVDSHSDTVATRNRARRIDVQTRAPVVGVAEIKLKFIFVFEALVVSLEVVVP